LSGVVVDIEAAIFDMDDQGWPLFVKIIQCFALQGFRQIAWQGLVEPGADFIQLWHGVLLTHPITLIRADVLEPTFNLRPGSSRKSTIGLYAVARSGIYRMRSC
jgi:hypothetical protein